MASKEVRVAKIEEISQMLRNREILEISIVARKLMRSERTIRDWIYEGKVEGRRIGGVWYVVKRSLEEFLKKEDI